MTILFLIVSFFSLATSHHHSLHSLNYCRLLHTQVAFCCFTDANKSQTQANEIIEQIGIDKVPMNLLITYYKALSMLYFAKSDYNLSYDWSVKALQLIGPKTPDKWVTQYSKQTAWQKKSKIEIRHSNSIQTPLNASSFLWITHCVRLTLFCVVSFAVV